MFVANWILFNFFFIVLNIDSVDLFGYWFRGMLFVEPTISIITFIPTLSFSYYYVCICSCHFRALLIFFTCTYAKTVIFKNGLINVIYSFSFDHLQKASNKMQLMHKWGIDYVSMT